MTEERRPRVLIASRNLSLLRAHHEDVIVALARAGVQLSIRYGNDKWLSVDSYRETLRRRGCTVSLTPLPRDLRPTRRHKRPADLLAFRLRQLSNLLRYYHPDYRGREWLRERWFLRTSPGPRRWARRIGRLGSRASLLALRLASSMDRLLPASKPARALLAAERPDAVVTVAMVWNPELADLLKAAAEEGIPTSTWIQSWDNLSNKGLLHFVPDRVFVWNETQRDELLRYHGVPSQYVCITGAQSFDYWFDGAQPSGRDAFCMENGIDPQRPIILYLSSSRVIEPPPAMFFLRWLEAIRLSGEAALEEAFVLVRPHPQDVRHWSRLDVRDPRVAVSPSAAAATAHSAEFRRRYRDELHHASVVVGLNTSGMIDAAILGKAVCTVELPELTERQDGTVHFQYLMKAGSSFVRTSGTFDEHVRMLGELVRRDPYRRDERSGSFVQAFVRPHGAEITPATVFTDQVLQLLEAPSEVRMPSRFARSLGLLVSLAAPALGMPFETGRRSRFFNEVLPRASHDALKPLRHFVLVVLPVGIRVRLIRLRVVRPATAASVPADLEPKEVSPSAEPIPAGWPPPTARASSSPPLQGAPPH